MFKSVLIITVHVIIFVTLFLALFYFMGSVYEKKLIRRRLWALHDSFEMYETRRREHDKELKSLYGLAEKKDILSHLEKNLKYSGLGGDDYGISMELYILFLIVGSVMSLIGGIVSFVIFNACCEGIMIFIRKKRFVKTESMLLSFINSVETYSAATSDVVTLLEWSKESVEGFLKKDIERAIQYAKKDGNSREAFIYLEESLEHPFFKIFIRNLEAASRTTADYSAIVQGSREMLVNYTDNSKILENIHRDALVRLGILCLGGVVCAYMSSVFILDISLKELIDSMYSGVIGKCILGYILGVGIYIVYIAAGLNGSGYR